MKPTTDLGENPYAPPGNVSIAEGIPEAPHSFGWRMENGRLWLAESSRLPMIDLFSGQSDETMLLRKIEVRYRPWWLRWTPSAAALAILLIGYLRDSDFSPSTAILVFAGGWIIAAFVSLSLPKCTVRFFLTKRTLRIRKVYELTMQISLLLFVFGTMGFGSSGSSWLNMIPVAAGVVWIAGLIAGFWIQRRLSCQRMHENWFRIQGIHRKAITHLTGLHTTVAHR